MNKEILKNAVEKDVISANQKSLITEYNNRLVDNNVPIIYNLRHLRKLLNISKKEQNYLFSCERYKSYRTFVIKKKLGGNRIIEAPNDRLKAIQLWIKENILDNFQVSQYAKGFVKGLSIYDNALPHVNKELVINIDLKDFFPSIEYGRVFKLFYYIGYTKEVCHLLSKLCTNSQNVLPQGSPASPSISNLVSLKLDKRLSKLADSASCTYTRYADDITFSGTKSIKSLVPIITNIINDEGFTINPNKLRLQYSFQRQEVTGLIVNNKVSIPKKSIKEIENAIYYCSKYGVYEHMKKTNCNKGFYKEHLYGLAYYIHMVDKTNGRKYLKQLDEINWSY